MAREQEDTIEHPAELRLREISDLIVALTKRVSEYPANRYMIDRLKLERLQLMQRYIKVVSDA